MLNSTKLILQSWQSFTACFTFTQKAFYTEPPSENTHFQKLHSNSKQYEENVDLSDPCFPLMLYRVRKQNLQ